MNFAVDDQQAYTRGLEQTHAERGRAYRKFMAKKGHAFF